MKKKVCLIIWAIIFSLVLFFILLIKIERKMSGVSIECDGYDLQIYGEITKWEVAYSEYDEERDSDWSYISSLVGTSFTAKGNNNYYLRLGEFVYLCDFESNQLIPLCSKENCPHDREPDLFKKQGCNAYVPLGDIGSGIQYYEGKLYLNSGMDVNTGGFEGEYIYELKLDGSERKVLDIRCEGAENILFHRNYVFYISCLWDAAKERNNYQVHVIDLNNKNDEVIIELSADLGTDLDIIPYGNCLYISLYSDRYDNYYILFDMQDGKIQLKKTDKAGVLYPQKDEIWICSHGNKIQKMKLDGTILNEGYTLADPTGTRFLFDKAIGSRSWYISTDGEFLYQLMNSESATYLGIYNAESGAFLNDISINNKLFFFPAVGFDDDRVFMVDGYFEHPAVYWIERDKILDMDAQFHVLTTDWDCDHF